MTIRHRRHAHWIARLGEKLKRPLAAPLAKLLGLRRLHVEVEEFIAERRVVHLVERCHHLLVEHALGQRQRIGITLEEALSDFVGLGVELGRRNGVVDDAHGGELLGGEGPRQHQVFLGDVHAAS